MPSGVYMHKIKEDYPNGNFPRGFQKDNTIRLGIKHSEKSIEKMCIARKGKNKGQIPWNKGEHPEYLQGENHWQWKGGKCKDERGYILIKNNVHPFCNKAGYVREHRLIIEKQIGRYLHRWEVSHHINKIKTDNRPKNLMAFKNHSIHRKFENGNKINPSDIIFDGRKLIEKNLKSLRSFIKN